MLLDIKFFLDRATKGIFTLTNKSINIEFVFFRPVLLVNNLKVATLFENKFTSRC